MSDKTKTITLNNFEQTVLNSTLPVLVDFWAPWCVYCRRIDPAIKELAEDASNSLTVGKVDMNYPV